MGFRHGWRTRPFLAVMFHNSGYQLSPYPAQPTNRSHEGCCEEWESGDVVWLGLRLDDYLDAGPSLERLGEVALLAESNDVVVKDLRVAI
jgi:hypothetical protein